MKKAYLLIVALLLFLGSILTCCKPESMPGSIFGTVIDKSTTRPVSGAGVKLLPNGLNAVTGTDGTFEFKQIDPGEYNLYVTKTGYQDLKSSTIVVRSGEQAHGDVQIEKMPASLQILDNDGNVITELDFGGDAGVISKTFKLYNRGDESFRVTIYKDVDWIESITPSTGTVPVNGNFPVIIKINREKLANGINTTSIIISSETVGGVELTVKATKGITPTVITTTITNVTSTSAVVGGGVTSNGNITVTQTGVCYSTSQNPTISNHFVVGNSNTGNFTCNLTGLTPNTKYYVRAYATNGAGTAYGEQKEFTTNSSIPTFQYAGTNYYVHPEVGTMTWQSAMDYCDNLTYAGYSDWFLPNKDELNAMYVYRNSIGGFTTTGSGSSCYYWSSSSFYSSYYGFDYYWFQDFADGSQDNTRFSGEYYRVRPVRKDGGGGGGGGTTPVAPTVTTIEPTNVTNNSATCGGNVTSDGGANVIQRGVCYSTSQTPTTSNQVVTSGTGTGSFTCNLTGLSSNTTYYVRAYAINSVGTSYGAQKYFTTGSGGGGGSGQTYLYSFESSWEDWTTIDADGDGNAWQRFYSDDGNIGHNNSVYLMGSESYINNVGPLTPDNYLVSPQKYSVSAGARISFYVCAQDANYPAEHYGVAISTASNPTANSFVTIWEETLSAKINSGEKVRGNREQGNWYLKTVDLSTYAGQTIWIAIRHFNCTDQFVLNVDDITIKTGD